MKTDELAERLRGARRSAPPADALLARYDDARRGGAGGPGPRLALAAGLFAGLVLALSAPAPAGARDLASRSAGAGAVLLDGAAGTLGLSGVTR